MKSGRQRIHDHSGDRLRPRAAQSWWVDLRKVGLDSADQRLVKMRPNSLIAKQGQSFQVDVGEHCRGFLVSRAKPSYIEPEQLCRCKAASATIGGISHKNELAGFSMDQLSPNSVSKVAHCTVRWMNSWPNFSLSRSRGARSGSPQR